MKNSTFQRRPDCNNPRAPPVNFSHSDRRSAEKRNSTFSPSSRKSSIQKFGVVRRGAAAARRKLAALRRGEIKLLAFEGAAADEAAREQAAGLAPGLRIEEARIELGRTIGGVECLIGLGDRDEDKPFVAIIEIGAADDVGQIARRGEIGKERGELQLFEPASPAGRGAKIASRESKGGAAD
jgi:hypothetical protein